MTTGCRSYVNLNKNTSLLIIISNDLNIVRVATLSRNLMGRNINTRVQLVYFAVLNNTDISHDQTEWFVRAERSAYM